MSKLQTLIKNKQSRYKQDGIKEVFKKEDGAIDLASIMVGVIVIGVIGGVIAATVFAVIPWSQDNAAKQQLDSIVQAENAYFGLSAAVPSPLPTGHKTNSFGKSAELETAKLLKRGQRYCVTTPDDGKTYTGYSQSSSGTIWKVTDKNTKPEIFTPSTDIPLPADCVFITEGIENVVVPPPAEIPYVDPTPTLTKLTYMCDTKSYVYIPMKGSLIGKLTWSDGATETYNGPGPNFKELLAGQTYTATFDGTYTTMFQPSNGANCLRSVDHWGSGTGVSIASNAFNGAINLTSVPENIPTTITNMSAMFKGTTSFNDPKISKWDVSNVSNMHRMFDGATNFNQPLNPWNVSKVADASFMFVNASSFNQSLNSWNVSSVTDMIHMFAGANAFNQDLASWDTTKVKSMAFMFGEPIPTKNGIKNNTYNASTVLTYRCDTTANVYIPMKTSLVGTITWSDGITEKYNGPGPNFRQLTAGQTYTASFEGTYTTMFMPSTGANCLRSVDHWGSGTGVTNASNAFNGAINLTSVPENIPTTITNMSAMFKGITNFNDAKIGKWDVSNVISMNNMFDGATNFNQPLNNWNVSKVTSMPFMFQNATNFNQPLNNWNVSNVIDMVMMFKGANAFSQDLASWDTAKVKSMAFMFGEPNTMKNNVKHATYNTSTVLTYRCDTTAYALVPMKTSMVGTITWSDGITEKYNGIGPSNRQLLAGQTYTVSFEGTYTTMFMSSQGANCLRSVDHWGSGTGVTNASRAFENTVNLTSVPDNIPSTITIMSSMFNGATSFNSPSVRNWDVSKVTNMQSMFAGATAFNQDLSSWNTAALTNGTLFAPASFPDSYMPAKTSK